ncbi:MAG: hypothetical protein ABIJ48_06195 [Actinomycetota bacterium]
MREMRWRLLVGLMLAVAACTESPAPGAGDDGPVRLLVAGTVDLTGAVAAVAEADPAGLFREVRFVARRADLAIVAAAAGEAGELLAAAGFDAAICPQVRTRPSAPAPSSVGGPTVSLRCAGTPDPGPGSTGGPGGLPSITILISTAPGGPEEDRAGVEVVVARPEAPLAAEVAAPPMGRPQLVVTGLGALLSSASDPAGRIGGLLEILVDRSGVIAYRLGRVTHADFRVHFAGWDPPIGDAVLLAGEWWALARPVRTVPTEGPAALPWFSFGEVTAAARGDVTGDGVADLAVAYRHPFRPTPLSERWPGAVGVDSLGRSAHLGVFTLEGAALWAAGLIPHPVGALAACDGSVALAYTGPDDPGVVATGAAVWEGLGLLPARELPGPGTPGCADVDRDGHLDPVVLSRSW